MNQEKKFIEELDNIKALFSNELSDQMIDSKYLRLLAQLITNKDSA